MVLVPELLEGLPYEIFAIGTLDALEKAFMVILAPEATAYETLFGEKAVELTLSGYQKLLADGSAARLGRLKDFLIASNLAGTAYTGVWSRSRALPQERRGIPLAEVDRYFEGNRPENEKLKKQVALALRCTPEQAREEVKFYIKKIRPPDRRLKNGISRAEQITLTNRMVKMQDYFVGSYLPLLDIDQVMEIYRALY